MNSEYIALKIDIPLNEQINYIYPVIIKNNNQLLLVDCGYAGFVQTIVAEAKKQLISIEKLSAIFITHHDYDHIGGLAELERIYPNIKVISSSIQKPYIEKEKKSLRLQQAENLSENIQEIKDLFASVEPAYVNETVKNGDTIDGFDDVFVIETSGHMPEHLSLYISSKKVLIAGDALVAKNGCLGIAEPEYCLDIPEAMHSIERLMELDIEQVICYHGGVIKGDIKNKLAQALSC